MRRHPSGRADAAQLRNSGTRSKLSFGAILVVAIGLVAMVFSGGAAAGPTALPDGRAYEMVSPADKGGTDAEPRGSLIAVGLAGEGEAGLLYSTLNGLPGSEGAPLLVANVAKRGVSGWSNSPLSPPELNQLGIQTGGPVIVSDDLENSLVASKAPLTPDSPANTNLYVRRTGEPGFELVTERAIPKSILEETEVSYNAASDAVGASRDFGHIFFKALMPLTADSPQNVATEKLYEFSDGTLHNVGILPGETAPFTGSVVSYKPTLRPVSEDGSQVLFEAQPEVEGVTEPSQIFLRKDDAQTVEVSSPETGVEDPDGPRTAVLAGADASGSSVYFTSAGTLTANAYTGDAGGTTDLAPNLYRYDVASGGLTDLTIAEPTEELGADVISAVVSPSGESVFFVAGGKLASAATSGADNLYHWSEGEGITFIADVESGDPIVTTPSEPEAVTDASGDAIAFVSTGGLTGPSAATGVPEIYHWSVAEGRLACASCGSGQIEAGAHLRPAGLALGSGGNHPISADGTKVFFSTTDALVPQDSNGKEDVYEWEGTDRLISSGTGDTGSYLIDASPSGKDVYFATRDQLLPADRDENLDIYDAREGGGFPLAPAEPTPCEAEACRPPLSAAPAGPQLSSGVFDGPGNRKPKHHKRQKPKHQKKKHRAKKCTAKAQQCSEQRKSHKAHSGGKRG